MGACEDDAPHLGACWEGVAHTEECDGEGGEVYVMGRGYQMHHNTIFFLSFIE